MPPVAAPPIEEEMNMERMAQIIKVKPEVIPEYKRIHAAVWPEILKSIKDSGIEQMEIYRTGNRLFMIMDTEDNFSFEKKAKADAGNKKVNEWEKLMWKYQQALPTAKPGEKWLLMDKIFEMRKEDL